MCGDTYLPPSLSKTFRRVPQGQRSSTEGSLMEISLVIPVKNEEGSLENLYSSIRQQTRRPDEVVIVDGGSTDKTVEIGRRLSADESDFKFIETPQASPGRGRNIGIENARFEWIAFTDAGIKLEADWLKNLVGVVRDDPRLD